MGKDNEPTNHSAYCFSFLNSFRVTYCALVGLRSDSVSDIKNLLKCIQNK